MPGVPNLSALMLDRKGTWDAVVRRFAPKPEIASRLLQNRYYRAVSERLTGSHEYMAVEKLYDLVHSGDWDVVVLDTPPTKHAIDFFRAPDRVRRILDRGVLRVLIEPGRGLLGGATHRAVKLVNRVAGDTVMQDIAEFFQLFSGLSGGFRERSKAVRDLLSSPNTEYYVVVAAAHPDRSDVLEFLAELTDRNMRFSGFLVTRVRPAPSAQDVDEIEVPDGLDDATWQRLRAHLQALVEHNSAEAHRQRRAIDALQRRAGRGGMLPDVWLLPEVDPSTLEGLGQLASCLQVDAR